MSSKFNQVWITATTDAVESKSFSAFGAGTNVAIQCSNLGVGETLTLQSYDISLAGGADWVNVKVAGADFACSDENNLMMFALDVLSYRVVKSATANPIGVAITSNQPIYVGT